jgi:hypothetical protein
VYILALVYVSLAGGQAATALLASRPRGDAFLLILILIPFLVVLFVCLFLFCFFVFLFVFLFLFVVVVFFLSLVFFPLLQHTSPNSSRRKQTGRLKRRR